MLLGKVFKNINKKYKSIKFNKIRFDSRKCRPNDIFFAIKGNNYNGNNFINAAIKNGATIIISNLKFQGFKNNKILFIKTKNPRFLLAEIAKTKYFKKPKNIIGVTGTNGKTSITNFYCQILKLINKKVASVGTLGILSQNLKTKTNNTTLDVLETHKVLEKLKLLKIDNVILEASSHGLKQLRLNGINFNTGIFTNLSRDHLDYHKTFKDYLNSKLILFRNLLNRNGNIIFDHNIPQAQLLNKISKKKKLKKFNFGPNKSFFNILKIQKVGEKKKVNFIFNKRFFSFETSLIGNIQIKNLMFAVVAAYLSNIKIQKILQSLDKIKPIEGRLEKIGSLKNQAKVILDYAHTPEALKSVITNVREDFPNSQISLLLGCGGNRDKFKRGIMGKIANKYCDFIYITDDNPRSENPKIIRDQIKDKINKNKCIEVSSRSLAIYKSIQDLKSGNILIVAGKGHEEYQEYKKKFFFSDRLEIIKSINKKNNFLSNLLKTNILKENTIKKISKNTLINFASINSKKIKKNSLFIGVKGKRFDGNHFTKEAIKKGCILAISNIKNKNPNLIYKKNPLSYFNKICQIYRKSLNAVNIAITGSAGKTSVKELTGFSLSKISKVSFSKNSFNNKFGVPLSMFNTPQSSKFTILEVGMDRKGQIDNLTRLIKPDIGLITNISFSHIKNFKNLDQIAEAKGEIINNILPHGVLVINRDDRYYNYHFKKAKERKLNIISFSKINKEADICILNIKKNNKNFILNVKIKDKTKSFIIDKNLINYRENILASLGIISSSVNINKISKKLFYGFKIPKSRGSTIIIKKKAKKITIIDESYNSNPLSFKLALNNFDKKMTTRKNKFILIGDMLELGKYSKKLHIELSEHINKSRINKVYTIGKFTKYTFNKLKPQIKGKILKKKEDVFKLIEKELPHNSFLMVKGSNSTGLNKIIQSL